MINAVLLGALAGSGRLPIPDAAFEAAIREGGKSVDTNLAAFAFGRGHARGELEQAVREHRKRQAAAQGVEDLIERARTSLSGREPRHGGGGHPPPRHLSGPPLRRALSRPPRHGACDGLGRAVREAARHLAVRMSFEDVIRVAQAKTSRERLDACGPRCGPSRTSRSRSPSISSPASRRSPPCCRRPGAAPVGWAERTAGWARSISPCMCAARRSGLRPPAPAGRPALVAAAYLALCRGAGRDRALAGADPRGAGRSSLDLAREIAEWRG